MPLVAFGTGTCFFGCPGLLFDGGVPCPGYYLGTGVMPKGLFGTMEMLLGYSMALYVSCEFNAGSPQMALQVFLFKVSGINNTLINMIFTQSGDIPAWPFTNFL